MAHVFTRRELEQLSKPQLIDIILALQQSVLTLQEQVKTLETKIQQLEKNSSNSSKPPSSDQNKIQKNQSLRKKSGKKSGGQKGHTGSTRLQDKKPDEIVTCRPETCSDCGNDLVSVYGHVTAKRQEADIPPVTLKITEYQQEEVVCPCCQRKNKGMFPAHITTRFQFGDNIKSFITYLNIKHKIPYERLTEIFEDMLNVAISEGTIENVLESIDNKASPICEDILQMIKQEKWIGSDETGVHVNGKKWWEWVWQNHMGSYYAFHSSRGYQVVEEYFGEDYNGSLIHDCWSAQNNTYAGRGHQLCHPHLIRDLIYLIGQYKSTWAYQMMILLLKSERARDAIWDDSFDVTIRDAVVEEYQTKLNRLVKQEFKEAPKEIITLQKRFRKHQEKILFFMSDKNMPFHNNSSEQAIRNAKIHQKISGGFRSENGAQRHARILSIIETCKKHNLNVLDSLRKISQGSFSFQSA